MVYIFNLNIQVESTGKESRWKICLSSRRLPNCWSSWIVRSYRFRKFQMNATESDSTESDRHSSWCPANAHVAWAPKIMCAYRERSSSVGKLWKILWKQFFQRKRQVRFSRTSKSIFKIVCVAANPLKKERPFPRMANSIFTEDYSHRLCVPSEFRRVEYSSQRRPWNAAAATGYLAALFCTM